LALKSPEKPERLDLHMPCVRATRNREVGSPPRAIRGAAGPQSDCHDQLLTSRAWNASGCISRVSDRVAVGPAANERELQTAVETMVRERIGLLLVGVDFWFREHPERIAELAVCHGIPASYESRTFPAARRADEL